MLAALRCTSIRVQVLIPVPATSTSPLHPETYTISTAAAKSVLLAINMKLFTTTCLFLLNFTVTLVSAHGYVGSVTMDGVSYPGNTPAAAQPTGSVIREVSTISPVKGATNPDLNCGMDSEFAEKVASANPGDRIQIGWIGGGGQLWPHNTGPLMTYMTACQGNCTTYNASSAQWFKIDQVGRMSDNTTWYQQLLMSGAPINVTLPNTLASGYYLIRSEIIALHLATSVGGAEFYPACIQVKVGGDQTGGPNSNELVQFPGTGGYSYTDTDPGIYDPDVFTAGSPYTYPGPPIAQFAIATSSEAGSLTSSSSSPSSSSGTSGSSIKATGTSTAAAPTSSATSPLTGTTSSSLNTVCRLTSPQSSTSHTRRALQSLHWRSLIRQLSF